MRNRGSPRNAQPRVHGTDHRADGRIFRSPATPRSVIGTPWWTIGPAGAQSEVPGVLWSVRWSSAWTARAQPPREGRDREGAGRARAQDREGVPPGDAGRDNPLGGLFERARYDVFRHIP